MSEYNAMFRSQDALLSDLNVLLRDSSTARWTAAEKYFAINRVLSSWHNKVKYPRYYEISWVAGTYAYDLPAYMDTEHMSPMALRTIFDVPTSSSDSLVQIWDDIPFWRVVPDDTGGQDIVLEGVVYTTDGRIYWWGSNGELPTTVPTVETEINSSATSLVLNTVLPNIGKYGYLKIGSEYMSYAGVSDDGSNTTLTLDDRGLQGSTAATHTASTSVNFCVATHTERLLNVLLMEASQHLFFMKLTDGSAEEKETYERMWSVTSREVEKFWQSYVPPIRPKMVLSRRSMGELGYTGRWILYGR